MDVSMMIDRLIPITIRDIDFGTVHDMVIDVKITAAELCMRIRSGLCVNYPVDLVISYRDSILPCCHATLEELRFGRGDVIKVTRIGVPPTSSLDEKVPQLVADIAVYDVRGSLVYSM